MKSIHNPMRWRKEWQRAKSSCEELLVDRNNIGEWTSRLLWKWIKWLCSRFASNSKAAVACLIGFGAYIGMQRPVSFTNRFNGRSIPFHLPYHLAYCLTLSLSLVFGSLKLKSCHRHWCCYDNFMEFARLFASPSSSSIQTERTTISSEW